MLRDQQRHRPSGSHAPPFSPMPSTSMPRSNRKASPSHSPPQLCLAQAGDPARRGCRHRQSYVTCSTNTGRPSWAAFSGRNYKRATLSTVGQCSMKLQNPWLDRSHHPVRRIGPWLRVLRNAGTSCAVFEGLARQSLVPPSSVRWLHRRFGVPSEVDEELVSG